MFKPMFRPMFRNKVTFEKRPPNTKYALGGLGSYRNKVTFYIKGNLKGNLISEHACERACVHAHERACVHAYVRAYMRMCDPFVRPLHAPSRGWARPQNCTGFEYQQLCTSILGLYSRCTIISAQVDCTNYHQAKQDSSNCSPVRSPPSSPPRSLVRATFVHPFAHVFVPTFAPPLTPRAVFNISTAARF